MNPKTARFLISGIEAFQKDPNLSALNGISKAEFLFLVTQIAGKDNLEEARKSLEQIAQGLISPPTPQHLQKLVSDLESWHQASEAQLPDKIAFVQGKAAALVARLHSTETPQKEVVFEPKFTPVPRPTRIATSPRVAAVATEKEKPPPPKISPLIAYLSVKTIRKPIFLDVASQLASIPTAPLRFLHHLGAEELEKTHPQESQTLTLFWQLGITSERLKGTLRDFSSQDPKTYTPKHPVVKALTTQTNLLESYERKHPIITSLFSARHRPQNLELLISEMPLPPEKVLGAKVFQINVAPSGFISSLAKVAVGKGIRFTISQAGSKLAKTAFVKTVTAPAKKLAAGILVKLGLTALAAAATGPLGAAITFVLTTVLTKIVGKVLGWIGNRLRAILPKDWGWVGLAVATGLAALGLALPVLAPILFPAAILIGGASALIYFAGTVGSLVSAGVAVVGGFLSLVSTAVGVAPAVIVGVVAAAIGIPAALTAYTNITYQSSFLEEVAAEVPAVCLPTQGGWPGKTIPAPPGLSFSWPVRLSPSCTSNYGYRVLNGSCNEHEGIDVFTNLCGTEIYPIARGTVYLVGGCGGFGSCVVIKHAGNFYSLYAHLENRPPLGIQVSVGQTVNTTTLLGYSGNTGASFGCHLHLAISSCGDVPGCFTEGPPPDPCNYFSCPSACGFKDSSVCGNLPICR